MTARAVRRAGMGDLDDVLALIHGAASWLHGRGIEQWPHESPTLSAEAIGAHIAAGHTWLAFEDGRPVATIAADTDGDTDFWEPWQLETPAWYISKLAASRDATRGLGTMLLRWAVDKAYRDGMVMVRLDVWRTNTGLQDFYRRQGWTYRGTVELPWRKSGALFEVPAAPDVEAREFWEPAGIMRPAWLARMLRRPLTAGTRVVTGDGSRGVVESVERAVTDQPEAGTTPEYPQDLYHVRTTGGAVLCRDIDLELDATATHIL